MLSTQAFAENPNIDSENETYINPYTGKIEKKYYISGPFGGYYSMAPQLPGLFPPPPLPYPDSVAQNRNYSFVNPTTGQTETLYYVSVPLGVDYYSRMPPLPGLPFPPSVQFENSVKTYWENYYKDNRNV